MCIIQMICKIPHSCGRYFTKKYDISFDKIKNIFITHSQLDHFHAPTICHFATERKKDTKNPICVWGTEIVRYMLEQEILLSNTADVVRINTLTPLHRYHFDNVHILPLPANHLKGGYFSRIGEVSLNYIITIGSDNILYAVDTGYPEKDILDIWNQYKFKVVILEATLGDSKEDQSLGHLNFEQSIEIIKQLRANSKIDNKGQVILTHLNQLHILEEKKTKKRLEKIGIRFAYDGMQISL